MVPIETDDVTVKPAEPIDPFEVLTAFKRRGMKKNCHKDVDASKDSARFNRAWAALIDSGYIRREGNQHTFELTEKGHTALNQGGLLERGDAQ
ncbi:hypothetical protein G3I44_14305 [Halogeometricum borinquense]|uniref:Transcriptional regulator n=1 Tax=Halogeometricum borinquense TaxID=60847 RepID=A0A6C0UQY5_9EURY|nr:hypothetical protein [Halogeometricum borinquense]QIB75358.1 hypothetical protein G3I44_14305 [Halogeometricum borinquense]